MQRRAILFLLAAVAALSALLLLRRREIEEAARPPEAVFPGLDAQALERMEVHHLERGTEVVLESDASGRWFMTEPVPYPADAGLVAALRAILAGTRGLPVDGADPAALGLDPPRILVVWRGAGSGRLELGAHDVDGASVYGRADGRMLRLSVAVSNTLELNPDDFRDRAMTALPAEDVVSLRRSGALVLAPGEPETDLALDALLDPERGGWTSRLPRAVALDPVLTGFLVRGAAELRVERFERDPPLDLAEFGLAAPRLRVELEDARGRRAALLFGCLEAGPVGAGDPPVWFACREGYPHVWRVERRAVGLLAVPAAELYDTLLLRARREEIAAVELSGLSLARDGEDWVVRTPAGDLPADPGAVSDVLADLEFARVEGFDPELALLEPRARLSVTLRDGRRLGGELGQDLPEGRVALRRFGDELVGTADKKLLALARTGASEVRSRRVHALEDVEVSAVQLSGAARSARFERDPQTGRWRLAGGSEEPSHAFYTVLERLLYLEARAWLAEAPAELAFEVRVSIERAAPAAGTVDLAFGTDAGGRALCIPSGDGAAEVDGALCADLRALLQ